MSIRARADGRADSIGGCVNTYSYIITIETDTEEHALRVLAERIGFDEDYGFDYSLDATGDRLPEPSPDQ
jgi:hypothetical protein